ncbi:M14 family zinc carboxypeptidase [Luteimonas kalidii]|uniref:M14 family zinc carboxypeptidase n=1 Tax=Luteimonas kalidii TaxID=3042025 RepID=A0ABT6JRX7_9GAMM|nr:M14 family zinc carboxypeptidase [Luteimonas kalidii]MDH5833439.1 M14 family zinc carboxypeptidase [Luteimonas kalidii]
MPNLPALSLLLCVLLWPPMSPAQDREPATTPTTPPDTMVPPAPAWLEALDALYDQRIRVAGLEDRRFAPEQWWSLAGPLASDSRGFRSERIGRSAEGRPLRYVSWGEGDTRVLLWSQMHGDESTASMALADLFRFLGEHPRHPLVQRWRRHTSLHFFPIVNPDGAARFQRRNAQGIDINRDARALATPEGRALHDLRERLQPRFGFNLHDQDVGTRVGDTGRGTAIALLAPPYNQAREVDAARARAIEVSVAIRAALEPYVAGRIARWDDTFNPRAFGDLTAQAGVSTILVESGGIEGDLQKQQLRKLNFLALAAALDAIATGAHAGLPHAAYRELPENGSSWADLRISGGTLVLPGRAPARADLVLEFDDALLERGATVLDIGDLAGRPARRTIDATGLYIVPVAIAGSDGSAGVHAIAPRARAYFHLSRDPQGREIVWTLAGDVDPDQPAPARD